MLFCNFPITVDNIIALSNHTKHIPYNIESIIAEFNITITSKESLRYVDEVAEVNFNNLEDKFARIFILDHIPYKLKRFMLARLLYLAINDPDKVRYNHKTDVKSYFIYKKDITNPNCTEVNNNANKFALDLLIPVIELEKYTKQRYFDNVDVHSFNTSKIELLATYFNVTSEMITTQLYYHNREIYCYNKEIENLRSTKDDNL